MKPSLSVIFIALLISLSACDENETSTTAYNPYDNFKVLEPSVAETQSIDSIVNARLGSSYRILDFEDMKKIISIEDWATSMKLVKDSIYLVTDNGSRFYQDGINNRQYFFQLHNHIVPNGFLVHDSIENHYIDLGSYYGLSFIILCVKR